MTPVRSAARLYSIAATRTVDRVAVKPLGTSNAIDAGYSNLQPIVIGGRTYILGYRGAAVGLWTFTPRAPWLAPVAQTLAVGPGFDIVTAFAIGNGTAIACYAAKQGQLTLHAIGSNLTLSGSQPHESGTTPGFTTLGAFASHGDVSVLGYDAGNGRVALYAVQKAADSGSAPFTMTQKWSHTWARGWTRFAFFQLGGETFFLKTNTAKPNVNIDHVLDGLAGTEEVGTALDPKKVFQQYSMVRAFTLANGDPYFATCSSSGAMTVNHIHADCLGWTKTAALTSKKNATQMAVVGGGATAYLIVY